MYIKLIEILMPYQEWWREWARRNPATCC